MTATLEEFAAFAETLAGAARAETLPWLETGGVCEDKNTGGAFDPVTAADRGAERAMRALIKARYPEHGIEGEEFETREATGPDSWSLDPIDGTRAFVCGLPGWTTLIALVRKGQPVVGLIDAPRLDEQCVGWGDTAWLTHAGMRRRLRVSGCRSLAEARLATTDPCLFSSAEAEGFARVRQAVRLTRYGFDAYAYARLAAGMIDLVIESGLKPHDYNALIPVVRGAGGMIGNWRGEDDFSEGKLVAAASPELFEAAVEQLAGV